MKAKGKKFPFIPLLLLAALVTSLFSGATLAKYSSTFGATGVIQVAAFAGGGSMDFDIPLEGMKPSATRTVAFSVRNFDEEQDCEVQMTYDIQVKTTNNLPLTFTLLGHKEAGDNDPVSTVTGGLDADLHATGGRLPVVAEEGDRREHSYELNIKWKDEESDSNYSDEIDMVTVTVTAVQVDPNGGAAE